MDPKAANLLITSIQRMDRQGLIDALLAVPTRFPMDFSAEFLATWPLDRLRHVLYVASTEAAGPQPEGPKYRLRLAPVRSSQGAPSEPHAPRPGAHNDDRLL